MALDPRTPVLVGTGQLSWRNGPDEPLEPVELMARAARAADADAGVAGLSARADSVRVVGLLTRRYPDPAAVVAERLGASPRQTVLTTMGGNSPQTLVNVTALAIANGDVDIAVLCGAESWRTRQALRTAGKDPEWSTQREDAAPDEVVGEELVMNHEAETARGIFWPIQLYPLFESALRAEAGRTHDEQARFLGGLWAGFASVAATNPHAWVRSGPSAAEISTPTAANRMVGFPYPKLMNSNNSVDQGAALLLCSLDAAQRAGVSPDRMVFPLAGTDAHDHPFVSHRADLRSSPAIRIAGRAALELAGVGIDDVTHVDLYSCFPSAVQIGAAELGLGLDRPLTVTGGLTFAGGPWNNYVMHAIATMAGVLRADEGSVGLCTANGGYVTKHAIGLYSTTPPVDGFRHAHPQDQVDALPARALAEDHDGDATVEAYTVMYERDGEPSLGIAACLTPAGARTWATTTEPGVMKAMTIEEFVGRPVTIGSGGDLFVR